MIPSRSHGRLRICRQRHQLEPVAGPGGGKSDAFQAGVYGATKYGPAYLAAAFAFANHWMSTDRLAFGDHLTADFNAQSYGGRLEGGYRFATPFAGSRRTPRSRHRASIRPVTPRPVRSRAASA